MIGTISGERTVHNLLFYFMTSSFPVYITRHLYTATLLTQIVHPSRVITKECTQLKECLQIFLLQSLSAVTRHNWIVVMAAYPETINTHASSQVTFQSGVRYSASLSGELYSNTSNIVHMRSLLSFF